MARNCPLIHTYGLHNGEMVVPEVKTGYIEDKNRRNVYVMKRESVIKKKERDNNHDSIFTYLVNQHFLMMNRHTDRHT